MKFMSRKWGIIRRNPAEHTVIVRVGSVLFAEMNRASLGHLVRFGKCWKNGAFVWGTGHKE